MMAVLRFWFWECLWVVAEACSDVSGKAWEAIAHRHADACRAYEPTTDRQPYSPPAIEHTEDL